MYFKYLGSPRTEIGVKIFGPVHGGSSSRSWWRRVLVGHRVKWGVGTWLLALLGSIVPLGSVIFVIWADRTGRMGARRAGADPRSARSPEAT